MKRNTDPETVLRNLRTMIEEAEASLSQSGEGGLDENQISELRERVQMSFNRLREYYSGVGERVSSCYSDAENRLKDYYGDVENRLRNRVETTDQSLRAHPYRTAAAAFGAGLVIGSLIRSIGSR